MEQTIILRKSFKVTILSVFEGVVTSYWYRRDQAIDFIVKYSDVDPDFISGIVQARTRYGYEVVYFKSK